MAGEYYGGQLNFFQKKALRLVAIALVCAIASVACYRTGILMFFYLLPLSLSAFLEDAKTAWAAGILSITLNILVSFWFLVYQDADIFILAWNSLHYFVMVLCFTWINAPLGKFWVLKETPYRMVLGAGVCTVLILPLFFYVVQNNEMQSFISAEIEALNPGYLSDGSILTTEKIVSTMIYYGLRGGLLVYCLVFWLINRQFAMLICRIIRRSNSQGNTILGFRTPFFMVWVLSVALGVILLGKIGKIELLEIGGWNILVLSATLFLVQGGTIALYFLMQFPPLSRIIINIGIIILLFRPKINIAFVGMLVLLGIAENWVPFRTPKQ